MGILAMSLIGILNAVAGFSYLYNGNPGMAVCMIAYGIANAGIIYATLSNNI